MGVEWIDEAPRPLYSGPGASGWNVQVVDQLVDDLADDDAADECEADK
jgi:hypothetical protein